MYVEWKGEYNSEAVMKKSQYGNDYDKIMLVIKYKSEVSIIPKLFKSIDKVLTIKHLKTYRKLP